MKRLPIAPLSHWQIAIKFKQETLPEIPTTERVIKSTRNYIESIYVLQQM